MSGEAHPPTRTLNENVSEAELVELIRGIDRKYIIQIVKHNKYLRQHVFPGFRPSHLPWRQVPTRLARDVSGDPNKLRILLKHWRASNHDLLEEVAALPVENLREGVIKLLIRRGVENRGQILWALRIDSRPEVQERLRQGLAQELFSDFPALLGQAQGTLLIEALEMAQKQVVEAESKYRSVQAEVDDLRRLMQRKSKQVEWWRDSYEKARESYEKAMDQQAALRKRIAELENQHRDDQAAIAKLQRQLEDEQAAAQELRRSVADLKATLRALAEARDIDEILLELEEERKASARLRLRVQKLEQRLESAYTKRDKALEQVEVLRDKLERAEHDKGVIIEEKRRLHAQVKTLRDEVEALRTQREEQLYEQILATFPLAALESSWLDARQAIREHIHTLLLTLEGEGEERIKIDKMAQWQAWVAREVSLVKDVFIALSTYPDQGTLPDQRQLREAQKLLALRWYLLEYTRQAIQHAEETAFPV